jgi:hypothetical protein
MQNLADRRTLWAIDNNQTPEVGRRILANIGKMKICSDDSQPRGTRVSRDFSITRVSHADVSDIGGLMSVGAKHISSGSRKAGVHKESHLQPLFNPWLLRWEQT